MIDRIRVSDENITTIEVDAIVNAANSALSGGGGVDGAIHRAAGPELLRECLSLGHCPTGSAVVTQGYELPAKWVIHAVGPVWSGGGRGEADQLRSAYRSSLALARERGFHSIAFPAISCGAYRYPVDEAASIAVREVASFLSPTEPPTLVILSCFEPQVERAYRRALDDLAQEL